MSEFDPNTFLESSIEAEMATNFIPVPADTYQAHIEDISLKQAKGAAILEVIWQIHNQEELAQKLGFKELQVRQGIFLDVEEDGRLQLGPNKNVNLGRLRAALGMNTKGKPWNFNMLRGQGPCSIEVSVEPDKEDPEKKYNRVKKVSAAK